MTATAAIMKDLFIKAGATTEKNSIMCFPPGNHCGKRCGLNPTLIR